jgi:cold shock CspA family protein
VRQYLAEGDHAWRVSYWRFLRCWNTKVTKAHEIREKKPCQKADFRAFRGLSQLSWSKPPPRCEHPTPRCAEESPPAPLESAQSCAPIAKQVERMKPDTSGHRKIAKWGFGMAPLSETMRERYDNAVNAITRFLRDEITASEVGLDAISELKGMFSRSLRKDQWDWFTVYEQLGHPPRKEMRYFVSKLVELRKSLRDGESELAEAIKHNLVSGTLLHYLDQWRTKETQEEGVEHGWLYVLSTREEPSILKIGMTTRTVPERVKEINSATGVLYPYSARAVYKVKDARAAERCVFKLLSDYRVREDREFFEIPFPKAAKMIEEELFSGRALKRKQGRVIWFNESNGYGFIQSGDQEEIFVHITDVINEDVESLEQGQKVEFDIKHTGKGMAATKLTLVDE